MLGCSAFAKYSLFFNFRLGVLVVLVLFISIIKKTPKRRKNGQMEWS